ncbi:MAG: HIT domain-containing protein, partial [Luminiphilus sp.]
MFELDGRLAADTFVLGSTSLSRVLLMNDARFPWLILVPERADVSEPFELSEANQEQLWQESMRLGGAMKAHFAADKINVAALGNQVAQLHVHHIARFHVDAKSIAAVRGSPYHQAC